MSYSIIVHYRRSSMFVYKQLVTCTHFGVIFNCNAHVVMCV